MWKKLHELQLWKSKKYIAVLILEVLLLIMGICGLFGKNNVYQYGLEDMTANFGTYSEEDGGYKADPSTGTTGNLVDFQHICLPKGHYIVSLKYDTDVDYNNLCTVTASQSGFNGCLTNGSNLHEALDETDYDMWLLRDTDNIIVHATYNAGTLIVKGLTITETNALYRVYLFVIVCGILFLNAAILFREYDKKYEVSKKTKTVVFGLGLVTVLSSLPLMTDYIMNNGDTIYHLNRIEGLKDGILSGQFPVRIAPRWLEDNGYASAIFYSEIFLLPAAFLRILGFTVTTSYHIYIFLLNFLTASTSYYCFKKMFRSEYIGLLCSALHTLSLYRIYKTYMTGGLGETLAMIFLPFIVYGFYRVFSEDHTAKEYRWSFVPLTIGFSGIVMSHLLTGELVGGFTILLCIVMWKKVFRKETFWVLAKTVICSVLICAWFLVPFMDYMLTGNFMIQNVSARTIQSRGLYLAHLFTAIPFAGGTSLFESAGMVNTAPVSVGFTLMVILVVWFYLWFGGNGANLKNGYLEKREIGFGKIAAVFSCIAMIMSLNIFPWDWIQSKHSMLATLVSSLQFPTRLLTIASILLVALAGVVFKYILASGKEILKTAFVCSVCGLTVITSLFTMSDHLYKGNFVKIYNAAGMNYGYIAGAEYLPYGTDQSKIVFRNPESSENVVIESYEKGALQVDVNCYTIGDGGGSVTMPLLYYKGYQAYDLGTGEKLEVFDGENHSVSVRVPDGYSGVIRTHFVSPWYWRVAEAVTVISALGFILLYRRDKKKGIVS